MNKSFLARGVLLIIILVPFIVPYLQKDFPLSHDGETHVIRIAKFFTALSQGNFPPRWASGYNYGYGSPIFNFFYSFPYYLGSLFHFLGFSFENSFKLVIVFSWISGPIFLVAWLKEHFNKGALIGGLFYGLASYRLLDLFVRGDIGELLAISLIPLNLLFMDQILKPGARIKSLVYGSVSLAALIMSHNMIGLVFLPILVIYTAIHGQLSRRCLIRLAIVVGLGLFLSASFWLPAIFESRYLNNVVFIKNYYLNHFVPVSKIVWSSWGFGPNNNDAGGLAPQVGIIGAFTLVVSIFLLLKKVAQKKQPDFTALLFIVVIGIGIFMSTVVSDPIWVRVDLIQKFQFPWRFLFLSVISLGYLGSYVFSQIKSRLLSIITIVAIFLIAWQTRNPVGFRDSYPDSYYSNFTGSPYHHGEVVTKWTVGDPDKFPTQKIEIVAGQGDIKDFYSETSAHKYSVMAKTELKILDNTIYFPGWVVRDNGVETPIEFQSQLYPGLIAYHVPAGSHKISVVFRKTTIRKVADALSLGTVALMLILLLGQSIFYNDKRFKISLDK